MAQVHLQLKHNNTVRSLSFNAGTTQYSTICKSVCCIFKHDSPPYMTYLRESNSSPLTNENEWQAAVNYAKTNNNSLVVVIDPELSNSLLREQEDFVVIDDFVESSFEENPVPKPKPQPQYENPLNSATESLNEFLQNFPALLGTNTERLSQVFQQVTDTIDSTVESMKPTLAEIVEKNQSHFEQVACTVRDSVEDVVNAASKNFNDLMAQNQPSASSNTSDVFDGPTLESVFVADVNYADKTTVEPGTKFVKTWKVQNNGKTAWPEKTFLKYVGGSKMNCKDGVLVGAIQPGGTFSVSVEMEAPEQPGRYATYFRLCCPVNGSIPFGTRLWCEIVVPQKFEYKAQLERLLEMGFPEEICKPLLEANKGNFEASLNELLN